MKRALAGAVLAASVLAPHSADASGFALREDSAITNGEADAGVASGAADLSTITTNPAGMVFFDGFATSAEVNYINLNGTFTASSGTTHVGALPFATSGGNTSDPGVSKYVPATYILWGPTEDLRFGLGVTVPFGLATNYDSSSVMRYQALTSDVTVIDINPSIAYRVTPWLSVGGGFSVQRASVRLSNAIDLGTLVPLSLAKVGLITPAQAVGLVALGGGHTQNDGKVDLAGNSWAVGYDFGVIFEPAEGTRIGVSYRSDMDQDIKGTADFAVPTQYRAITAASGQFLNTNASAPLQLPGNVTVGLTQKITPQLTLDATYQWTHWSQFKSITVNFANPYQATSVQTENYKDTSFLSFGGAYQVDEALTLRAGAAYDQTPTQDQFRDLRLPDADRYWISLGASYEVAPGVTLTGSYEHLFFDTAQVDHAETVTAGVTNVVTGQIQPSVDLFGAEVSFKF